MLLNPRPLAALLAGAFILQPVARADAQELFQTPGDVTYADIADLADSAGLVVKVQILKMTRVEDERAPGLTPGHGRFYVQAATKALLVGRAPLGGSVAYLVDLPLDSRGRAPKLKKQEVFLFARSVPGRPGELQLVRPTAQQIATPAREARLRSILQAIVAPDAPAKVTGVREMLFVPGTLAGQGETQIFLNTSDNSAASITVRHEQGRRPVWGVSFSELVANVDHPPAPETLEWYRLACFLPRNPAPGANVSGTPVERQQAMADYRLVLNQLGPCTRTLR